MHASDALQGWPTPKTHCSLVLQHARVQTYCIQTSGKQHQGLCYFKRACCSVSNQSSASAAGAHCYPFQQEVFRPSSDRNGEQQSSNCSRGDGRQE